MPHTHSSFQSLSFADQLAAIWIQGRFLARRYEEEDAINLYHFEAGFFVELTYDPLANELVSTRTFTSAAGLRDYTAYIDLSELGLPE